MKIYKFVFSAFMVNTYVIVDEPTKRCAIIDPGMMHKEEVEALDNLIKRENLIVEHIINTHLHIDHAIGNAVAADTYHVDILAHDADSFLGEDLDRQAQMFGLPETSRSAEVTGFLEEGDIIKVGESELQVIHVPGHSPGSIALYNKKDGFLIVGDILFNSSIGRTDLPGGNHNQLINGIKSKLLTLPDDTIVYPGHGPETTIGREKTANPFLV